MKLRPLVADLFYADPPNR